MKQIMIGLVAEGTTDIRFLENIVYRTFEDVACRQCDDDIEIITHNIKDVCKGDSFTDMLLNASKASIEQAGAMTLVVHADSDTDTYQERYIHKFSPALDVLENYRDDDNYCSVITPLIPVKMMEAWMLADVELLKEQIGTTKSDAELGMLRFPETIADPKAVISEAIRIATSDLPKRRQRLSISDLYGVIGGSLSLEKLSRLPSYQKFVESVEETYHKLGYIRDKK